MTTEQPKTAEAQEKPFSGLVVYYSGSIRGVPEAEPDFAWQLVRFMIENGAIVLSEHVAARTQQERDEIRARNIGMSVEDMLSEPNPHIRIRRNDVEWVDAASHFVALVNAPSHGVGMEIERALLKTKRGLNETQILSLVHEANRQKLSSMILSIPQEDYPNFHLVSYKDLPEAISITEKFLLGKLTSQQS